MRVLNANTTVEDVIQKNTSTKPKDSKLVNTNTLIRVKLSNYLVQGAFSFFSTIKTVYEFIDALLTEESKANYVLFTTPPRKKYKREMNTLRELGLIPNALLVFEPKNNLEPVVKKEIISKFLITI